MKIKYNMELMGLMNIFQQTTRANLKDCFIDSNSLLTFVVEQNEIGRAIGRNAINIKMLEKAFNRKIKIIEYNPELERFIENLIYPLKVMSVTVQEDTIILEPTDSKTRGYLIGRSASNLRNYEEIVKRYFDNIKEIKVV
ncbi:NusA-like transcription termination signal-binding factor [Candidatus Woesearchaeota archaeon]|nr:NusA-like transcription termination signal-binding factor [Candidatus Woesearchaeota archaeon]